jgi:HEAT repeat protein
VLEQLMPHRALPWLGVALASATAVAQDAAQREAIAKAIAEMRNLPTPLEGREAATRGPRIQVAWETLIAAKDAGVAALLAEAAALDAAKQRDDRFGLGAAAVVWQIGGIERVADVLSLWADADFAVKYSYAFQPAFLAARDGDERALPLLVALLRDQRGKHNVSAHVMELGWPLTHAFLWGPMGRKAVPALANVLASATDPTVVSSAIELLSRAWHDDSLPRLRAIAGDSAHGARTAAIEALGRFGHPDDWDRLLAGLADADAGIVRAHTRALCAFGDLRAVPELAKLTSHANEDVRLDAIAALGELPTVDGLEVFAACAAAMTGERRYWFADGPPLLQDGEPTWTEYQRLDREQRANALVAARARVETLRRPAVAGGAADRESFERACAAWIAASRIDGDEEDRANARRLLAAATAADVPLLLDLRGRLFRRLSDECLEEVALVDEVLCRVVRSRYRREVGSCERVEPPPVAARDGK